ncbi:hypothetical protein [Amaricoccus macauensis]|uniref:hypothetical protein n=1 Tax=Amaricoccus macauensis TaxID=57001 RepID=UPI003C7D0572
MPFPQNAPTAEDLTQITAQEIADMPVELLAILQHEIDARLAHAKAAKTKLDASLVLRYGDHAAEARRAHGKDTGTVRFDDGDITVVTDLPKRVEWDQAKLAAMVERIRQSKDDPADYVEVSFKVRERNYTSWPAAIRHGFASARTVKTGTLKVTLLHEEGAQ